MTGRELQQRLEAAERSTRWLAEKLGRSHTQVGRWLRDEQPIPDGRKVEIRALLVPVMVVSRVEIGAIVKAAPGVRGVKPDRRFKVITLQDREIRCAECGAVLRRREVIARDVFCCNKMALCLEHVVPITDQEVADVAGA